MRGAQKGMSSDNGVLLDSGANEILRQQETRPARSQPLPLTLANGSSIDAFRTKEGEVVAVGVENGDIICGVNRLCKSDVRSNGITLTAHGCMSRLRLEDMSSTCVRYMDCLS